MAYGTACLIFEEHSTLCGRYVAHISNRCYFTVALVLRFTENIWKKSWYCIGPLKEIQIA